ncbi:MAG TPA: tetratricopeptide repeat protein [Thermoanaerobaculia bacterium]|nr:tetratricopeptide repeat protein [Thermoanaerobaculia bacterium]
MKRLLILAVAAITVSGCAAIHDLRTDDQPYENPFYAKYLNTGSTLDANINRTLDALREHPNAPDLHNTLGALLVEKGFPKDAEREFERAIDADRKYYQAWYNLGLVRAAQGDALGARRAFSNTVDVRPGHSQALFQLGLIEEKRHHTDRAVHLYAKAFTINPSLLRVDANPRILDSKLTHLALLKMYPNEHSRRTMTFLGVPTSSAPAGVAPSSTMPAQSPQPAPKDIVTPAPPATEVGIEPTPVSAPSSAAPGPPGRRSTRGRQPRPPAPAPQPPSN